MVRLTRQDVGDVRDLVDDYLDRNQDDFDDFAVPDDLYDELLEQLEGATSLDPVIAPVTPPLLPPFPLQSLCPTRVAGPGSWSLPPLPPQTPTMETKKEKSDKKSDKDKEREKDRQAAEKEAERQRERDRAAAAALKSQASLKPPARPSFHVYMNDAPQPLALPVAGNSLPPLSCTRTGGWVGVYMAEDSIETCGCGPVAAMHRGESSG